MGRDLGLGTTPWDEPVIKAVAGIRYARLTDNLGIDSTTVTSTNWTQGEDDSNARRTSRNMRRTFSGVGPRAGLTVSVPILKPVTLDGSVDVAVLVGKSDSQSTQTFYSGSDIANLTLNPNDTTHSYTGHNHAIASLSFVAGPTFHLTRNFAITAAYKYEAFYNAMNANFDSGTQASKNVIIQGPEVRVKLSF